MDRKKKIKVVIVSALIIVFLAVLSVTVFLKTTYHSRNGNADITWLCIGDSITLGETNQNISYADYVGKLTGVNLIKEGHSGYTTERILSEIESIDAEADVITVFTGTNEWVYDVPVGDVEDRTPETFCGALNELMIYLKEGHPNAVIYFMTPIFRDMQYNPAIPFTGTVNSNGDGMDVYADAVVSCAENNGINVIDMYRLSGINEKNIGRLTNDGTHPNAWGHLKIAWTLKAYINE